MSDWTREQIEHWRKYCAPTADKPLADMALAKLELTALYEASLAQERERAGKAEAERDAAQNGTVDQEKTIHDLDTKLHQARQEAARLRSALWVLDGHARLYMTLAPNVDRQVRKALQSAPPASESGGGERCPSCGKIASALWIMYEHARLYMRISDSVDETVREALKGTGHEPWQPSEDTTRATTGERQVMPKVGGKSYRCECGCNVFTELSAYRYRCNSCGIEYKGEPGESDPAPAHRPFAWYRKGQGHEMLFAEDYEGPPPDEQGWIALYADPAPADRPEDYMVGHRKIRQEVDSALHPPSEPSEALEAIEKAQWKLAAVCRGDERWTMSVPARPDSDPDLVIATALEKAKNVLSHPCPHVVTRGESQGGGGVRDVTDERQRQVNAEGWSTAHDDSHADGELAMAAACYAAPEPIYIHCERECLIGNDGDRGDRIPRPAGYYDPWPWDDKYDKRTKHGRRRRLVIAASLVLAEIERLDRAAAPTPEPSEGGTHD